MRGQGILPGRALRRGRPCDAPDRLLVREEGDDEHEDDKDQDRREHVLFRSAGERLHPGQNRQSGGSRR